MADYGNMMAEGSVEIKFPLSADKIKQEAECDMLAGFTDTDSARIKISDSFSMNVTGGQTIADSRFCREEEEKYSVNTECREVLQHVQCKHEWYQHGGIELDISETGQQSGLLKPAGGLDNMLEHAEWSLKNTDYVIENYQNVPLNMAHVTEDFQQMLANTGYNQYKAKNSEEHMCLAPTSIYGAQQYEHCEDLVIVKEECQAVGVDTVSTVSLGTCSVLPNAVETCSQSDSCGTGFTDNDSRKAHQTINTIQTHINNKDYYRLLQIDMKPCDFDKSTLTDNKYFTCEDCGRKYARMKQIKTHLTTHTGIRRFVCHICNIGFSKTYGLKRHMSVHTGEKPFQCEFCTRSFSDNSNLTTHRKKHAAVTSDDQDAFGRDYGFINVKVQKRNHMVMKFDSQNVHGVKSVCSFRGKAHSKNHTKVAADTGSVFAVDSDCVVDTKVHTNRYTEEKPFQCDFCGIRFACLSHLKPHRRIHTGDKPYKCEFCGKLFSCVSNLTSHRRTHTGEKPFQCDICGVGFAFACSMKTHRRKHTGEKPYKCEVCGLCFTCSGSMTSHRRTHNGAHPHKCEYCGLSCASLSHLQMHRRTHTGDRPFHCDVCRMSFASSGQLKAHKRTHTGEKPFKCEYCCRSFVSSSQLKSHRRTHTGEKPFKCEVCPKTFTQNNSLMNHRRIHTGENPYICNLCGVSFAYQRSMASHRKKTHRKEMILNRSHKHYVA